MVCVMNGVCYVWCVLCMVCVMYGVCYVWCVLCMVCVMYGVCYVWCVLCMVCVMYGVCYVWCVLCMVCVMYGVCYVWCVLCMVCVMYGVCYVWCVLCMVCVMYGVCYVWCVLCMVCVMYGVSHVSYAMQCNAMQCNAMQCNAMQCMYVCMYFYLLRLFSMTKCIGCNIGLSSTDLVMQANDAYYHVTCFRCTTCSHLLQKGEKFGVRNLKIFCEEHYLENVCRRKLLSNANFAISGKFCVLDGTRKRSRLGVA